MKQQQVYNLKEFAARHHLESIFGAYAAHIYIDDLCEKDFIEMAQERTLFTKLVLVTRGNINMGVLQQSTEANDSTRMHSASKSADISEKAMTYLGETTSNSPAESVLSESLASVLC